MKKKSEKVCHKTLIHRIWKSRILGGSYGRDIPVLHDCRCFIDDSVGLICLFHKPLWQVKTNRKCLWKKDQKVLEIAKYRLKKSKDFCIQDFWIKNLKNRHEDCPKFSGPNLIDMFKKNKKFIPKEKINL